MSIRVKREQIKNLLDAIAKTQAIVDGLKAELAEKEKEEIIPRLHKALLNYRKKNYGDRPKGVMMSYKDTNQLHLELSKNNFAGSSYDQTVFGMKIYSSNIEGGVAFITESYDL